MGVKNSGCNKYCGGSGWEGVRKKLKGCRDSSKLFTDGIPPEERNRFAAKLF